MQTITVVVACLACASYARRQQVVDAKSDGSQSPKATKSLQALLGVFLDLQPNAAFNPSLTTGGMGMRTSPVTTRSGNGEPRMLLDILNELFPVFGDQSPDEERNRFDKVAQGLGVQQPKYDVLTYGNDWEVRKYAPMMICQTDYTERKDAYAAVSSYTIGGVNSFGVAMPPTAPCMFRPLANPKTMSLMLPNPHTPLEGVETVNAPFPLFDGLEVYTVPSFVVGVVKFAGLTNREACEDNRNYLARKLVRNGIGLQEGALFERYTVAQYSEMLTLPWERENEIWIPCSEEDARAREARIEAGELKPQKRGPLGDILR